MYPVMHCLQCQRHMRLGAALPWLQAVSLYTQLLRTRKVPDCGVRTVFVGKDSEVWKELIRADARRTSLCEELHGAPCSHAERAHCLQV